VAVEEAKLVRAIVGERLILEVTQLKDSYTFGAGKSYQLAEVYTFRGSAPVSHYTTWLEFEDA